MYIFRGEDPSTTRMCLYVGLSVGLSVPKKFKIDTKSNNIYMMYGEWYKYMTE